MTSPNNDQSQNSAAIPVRNAGSGVSTSGTVDGTGAQIVKAANSNSKSVSLQNTDATNILYISFTNPATTNDTALTPGAGWSSGCGVTNAIYGLSSGSTTAFAVTEVA